jgi:tetratricopeptide (TPR) repeat protein
MPPRPPALEKLLRHWVETPDDERDAEGQERELARLLESAETAGRPQDQMVILTYLALLRFFAEDAPGALATLDRAPRVESSYWFPVQFRGEILLKLGRPLEALAAFDRALVLLPRADRSAEPSIRLIRAESLRALRRFGEAAEDYRRVLDVVPNDQGIAYRRAIMHSLAGQRQVALRQLDDLIQRAPGNAVLLRDRAEILTALGDYVAARHAVEEAIEIGGQDPHSLRVRGRLAFAVGNFAEAADYHARAFDAGLSQGLPDPYALIWLRLARLRAGAPDAADSQRRRELARLPPWPTMIFDYLMGEASAQSLLAQARDTGNAFERDEQLCEAHFYIAEKLLAEERSAEARRHLQAASSLGVTHFVEHVMATAELARLP